MGTGVQKASAGPQEAGSAVHGPVAGKVGGTLTRKGGEGYLTLARKGGGT